MEINRLIPRRKTQTTVVAASDSSNKSVAKPIEVRRTPRDVEAKPIEVRREPRDTEAKPIEVRRVPRGTQAKPIAVRRKQPDNPSNKSSETPTLNEEIESSDRTNRIGGAHICNDSKTNKMPVILAKKKQIREVLKTRD
ncbi:hypothetical protein JTB14_019829 [Gonioctena quinquepunctata]|nr:hypothetical protein JTB14_019829 [Gonioctena quinquepunctata]